MQNVFFINHEIKTCIEEIAYFAAKEIVESDDRFVTYDDSFLRDLMEYYNCVDDEKYIISLLKEKIEKELFVKGIFPKSIFIINSKVYFK